MLNQQFREKLKATHIPDICRYILAITFIFSGFVKTIDPWGTALKLEEYFTAFGVEWLQGWKMGISIWMCAAELMMGCMLFFRVRLRLISVFSVLTMTIFTGLTLVLVVWNPVTDCGCFGDAIRLTNTQTFIKNLILWPMSVVMWWAERDRHFFPFSFREGVLTVVFMTLTGSLGTYCYRHLPVIDLLPFKIGVNIAEDAAEKVEDIKTTLIYRDLQTGKQQKFELSDTTWYDTSRWEYVDTIIEGGGNDIVVSLSDFDVYDAQEDVTETILYGEGTFRLLCIQNLDTVDENMSRKFAKAATDAQINNEEVMCLTSSPLPQSPYYVNFNGVEVRCYNMDSTVLRVLMRAKAGMVTICDGTITDKRTFWDID